MQDLRFQDSNPKQDARRVGSHRSERSTATLVCDYSENELNQLILNTTEAMGLDLGTHPDESSRIGETPGKRIGALGSSTASPSENASAEKYSQLTKLHDEEENVDFIQMFNQY